jgi:hypothetical protein
LYSLFCIYIFDYILFFFLQINAASVHLMIWYKNLLLLQSENELVNETSIDSFAHWKYNVLANEKWQDWSFDFIYMWNKIVCASQALGMSMSELFLIFCIWLSFNLLVIFRTTLYSKSDIISLVSIKTLSW